MESASTEMGWLKRLLWLWLPPLAWMGLIFFLSAQPDLPRAPAPWLDTLLKKGAHACAFGVLAWLYLRGLRGRWRAGGVLRAVSASLAVAYAISDEYHQTFVPGRHGAPFDVGVDAAGICAAMLLDWWLARRRALLRQAQSPAAR
jgi:VanZ family protein